MENGLGHQIRKFMQSESFAQRLVRFAESHATFDLPLLQFKQTTLAEEKVAVNLAGYFALIAGVGYMNHVKSTTPFEYIDPISKNSLDNIGWDLVCRFANTTWKATQPYRALERIERPNFIPFSLLSEGEIEKDRSQIVHAAKFMLQHLPSLQDGDTYKQWMLIQSSMQDPAFSEQIAEYLEAGYFLSLNQIPPPFLKPGERTSTIFKKSLDFKTAGLLSYFYAIECALDYWVVTKQNDYLICLHQISEGSLYADMHDFLLRLTHANSLAGAAFSGLENFKSGTFKPFEFLDKEAINHHQLLIRHTGAFLLRELNF